MVAADGLFVYGPLREGGSQHAWLVRTHLEGITRAWVAGRLFHLPMAGYPALVPALDPPVGPPGAGWVTGDFVGYAAMEDLQQALEDLDGLEGVEEGRFTRDIRPVVLDGGHRYLAWVYVFHMERLPRLEREAVEIEGGDWAGYL